MIDDVAATRHSARPCLHQALGPTHPSVNRPVTTDLVDLADGRTVAIRPIRADDEDRLTAFHHHLSPETVRRRFFTAHPELTAAELHRFTHVDGDRRLALIALAEDEIVGVGRYETLGDTDEVEVAFVVRDDHQGVGLGTALLERVAAAAVRHGKRRLRAETLPENTAMRHTLRHLSDVAQVVRDGTVEITAPLA